MIYSTDWLDHARCRDGRIDFFDLTVAAPALRVCANCPVSNLCHTWVDPENSYFTGVCAGRVYEDGVEL